MFWRRNVAKHHNDVAENVSNRISTAYNRTGEGMEEGKQQYQTLQTSPDHRSNPHVCICIYMVIIVDKIQEC